jgi:hypothetical protein
MGNLTTNLYSNFSICLDESNHRLFVGTFVPSSLKIFNTVSGNQISELSIPNDCDDMYYDNSNQMLYLSCGDGFIEIIKKVDVNTYKKFLRIPTVKGARTSLWLKELGLYLLAAPKLDHHDASIQVYEINKVIVKG